MADYSLKFTGPSNLQFEIFYRKKKSFSLKYIYLKPKSSVPFAVNYYTKRGLNIKLISGWTMNNYNTAENETKSRHGKI